MPNNKNSNYSVDGKIPAINLKKSGISEFVKRPLPNDKEVAEFEKITAENNELGFDAQIGEELDEEIEDSLNEIYQDDDGKVVDVKKMYIKKRHGFFYWFFLLVFFMAAGAGAYYAYEKYYPRTFSAPVVEFGISGKTEAVAGEEFFYVINYKNSGQINANNAEIRLDLPENFIVSDIYPESVSETGYQWRIDSIPAHSSGEIKIKGMLMGAKDRIGAVQAVLSYVPENFSSEFKKEAALATRISDIGLEFDFDFVSSVLAGEAEEIALRFNAKENNYIGDFRITLEPRENLEILPAKSDAPENLAKFAMERPGVWDVSEISLEEKILPIRFRFAKKEKDKEPLSFKFERKNKDESYSEFYGETLEFDVMNSDLNLSLIINGAREDKSANFGDTLNYSLVYKNKGETEMKDVVIMAVLESDFLDWTTLKSEMPGKEKGNTITWTKEEIPGLAAIPKNEEGIIDFSINLVKAGTANSKQEYQVKSYAQFNIGNIQTEGTTGKNNLSNEIISRINSDLSLEETIRYFSVENMPVGTGPHPPRVNETTTYKVYWKISNNLNELKGLVIKLPLPAYVSFAEKSRATVGEIKYDASKREVSWEIGRLPLTVFAANAEFSISVTPSEEDRNKIMVILPGSSASAIDGKTDAVLNQSTKAKTTKLEDDEIARGDGIVE